jgi:hypothetical protein
MSRRSVYLLDWYRRDYGEFAEENIGVFETHEEAAIAKAAIEAAIEPVKKRYDALCQWAQGRDREYFISADDFWNKHRPLVCGDIGHDLAFDGTGCIAELPLYRTGAACLRARRRAAANAVSA